MSFTKLLYIKQQLLKLTIGAVAVAATLFNPAWAQTLRIEVNKASILKLTKVPSTIIIGNPALADVTPQENNVLVLVGKASGRTNIIILDSNGDIMHNYDIAVQEEQSGNLTVFKAGKQWSYSCAPYCERVINPNDDADAFTLNYGQVMAKTGQMTKAAIDAASAIDSDIANAFTNTQTAPASNVVANNGGGQTAGGQGGANQAGTNQPPPQDELQTFTILPPE